MNGFVYDRLYMEWILYRMSFVYELVVYEWVVYEWVLYMNGVFIYMGI